MTKAAAGLAQHARTGTVKWRCGLMFASTGVVGALAGSTAGKAVDGHKLLTLFALLMLAIGALMLHQRRERGMEGGECHRGNAGRVLGLGLGAGGLSGFFGIGGGFLVVPSLIAATRMPILDAIGTSLVAVTAFGVTTALNYALSGLIDLRLAAVFVAGGFVGSLAGVRIGRSLAATGTLKTVFASVICAVAAYMLVSQR